MNDLANFLAAQSFFNIKYWFGLKSVVSSGKVPFYSLFGILKNLILADQYASQSVTLIWRYRVAKNT